MEMLKIGLAFLAAATAPRPDDGLTLPPDARAALRRNAAALHRISMEWTRTRAAVHVAEICPELVYGPDFFEPLALELRLEEGLYRAIEVARFALFDPEGSQIGFTSLRATTGFDGERLYQLVDLDGDRTLSVISLARLLEPPAREFTFSANLLEQAGYRVSCRPADHVLRETRSLPLELLQEGWDLIAIEELEGGLYAGRGPGLGLALARAEEVQRFELDPELGHVVRRRQLERAGKLIETAELSDFRALPDSDLLLPWSCVLSYHQWGGLPREPATEVLFREHLHVSAVHRRPVDPADFIVALPEVGLLVMDSTLPTSAEHPQSFIQYLYPASAAQLDEHIASLGPPAAARTSLPHALLGLMAGILAGCVAACWRRPGRRPILREEP